MKIKLPQAVFVVATISCFVCFGGCQKNESNLRDSTKNIPDSTSANGTTLHSKPILNEIAAETPRTAAVVIAVSNSKTILKEATATLDRLADLDEPFRIQFHQLQDEFRSFLGVDPFDANEIETYLGLDLDQTIGWIGLNPNKLLENGAVLTAAFDNVATFAYGMERCWEKQGTKVHKKKHDKGEILYDLQCDSLSSQGVVIAKVGNGRIAVYSNNDSDDLSADANEFLEEVRHRPLSESRQFKDTISRLPSSGDLRVFVSFQSIIDQLPSSSLSPLLYEFSSLGAELGASEISASLLLAKNSKFHELLQTGGSCKEFLSRMDQPVYAGCVSLKKPFELFRCIMERIEDGPGFEDETLVEIFGLRYDELCQLYADGAAGIAVFPHGEKATKVLTFIKVNDREMARRMAKKFGESGKRVEIGDNVVWIRDEIDCWGVVDGYLVGGDAEKQILNLARGEGGGWNPTCGGKQLASAQLSFPDFIETMSDINPSKTKATSNDFSLADGTLTAEMDFKDGVASLSITSEEVDFGPAACRLIACLAWYWNF